MNSTISYLCYNTAVLSPMFSNNRVNYNLRQGIIKNQYYGVINSIFRSRLVLKCMSFSNFLSQAIVINRDAYMINKVYEYTRQAFATEPIKVINSKFKNFKLTNELGGAMNLKQNLHMYNVLFIDCISKQGGGFYTFNEVCGSYVSFVRCSSEKGGAFYVSKGDETKIEIEHSSVFKSDAQSVGIYCKESESESRIYCSNMTSCVATSIGGIYDESLSISVSFVEFTKIKSSGENGGLMFPSPRSLLSINQCLFNKLSHNSKSKNSAAAIFIKEIGSDSVIKGCLFCKTTISNAYTIYAENGNSLSIVECIFTYSESQEIFAKEGQISTIKCKFSADVPSSLRFPNSDLGFIPERDFTSNGKSGSNIMVFGSKHIFPYSKLVYGAILSFILGTIYLELMIMLKKSFFGKGEKALE